MNDAPVAGADGASTSEDTAVTILASSLLANDSDIDGNPLTLTAVGNAVGGTVALDVNGGVVFTPMANFNGAAAFDYTISDGNGGAATQTVTVNVTPVNDAPVAGADGASTSEDTAVTILASSLLANDSDIDGNPLTLTAVGNAVGGTVALNVNGDVVFTPTADFNGAATFDYTVSDDQGGTATQTVTVDVAPVNDAPGAGVDSTSTLEDTAVTILASSLLANDSDIDGNPLTLTAVGNAVGGTVALDVNGGVVFTPMANFNGAAAFDYTISDGNGGAATQTVTVNVTPVNDAPVAGADGASTSEDTAVTILASSLLANDSDIDGNPLTLTAVGNAIGGTVALDVNGDVVFAPTVNFNGAAIFDYTVSDGNGGTATQTVTVDVAPVNDAPVTQAKTASTAEDTAVTILEVDLLAGATDVDGDALVLASVGNAVGGTVALDVNGDVVFTPDANFNGAATFDCTTSDGAGGTSTSTVTVDVAAVNDAPVASADGASTSEDTAVTIMASSLLANDTDIDGNLLMLTAVGNAVGGSVALNVAGDIVFTPTANFNGAATFDYTISDGQGGTATQIVTVNVAPVNDAPIASADSASTSEDAAVTILASSLLVNDSDTDGDPLTLTTVGNAIGGAVALDVNGNVVFTPIANFNGPAAFDYTVSDGNGGAATQTATVNVAAVNDAPVAQTGGRILLGEGQTVSGLLKASDIDDAASALTYSLVSGPAHGAVTLATDGSYSFQAASGYSGGDSFTWKVVDASGGESTAGTAVTVGAKGNWGQIERVNSYMTNEQTKSAIAALSNGNSLIAWSSEGQDGSYAGVYAQLLGPDGRPMGSEFRLNATTTSIQRNPAVDGFTDGGFIAAWEAYQDGSILGVYARLFGADGTPSTAEFQINTTTADWQYDPSVAVLDDGRFLVTWSSNLQDGSNYGVYGRLYSRDGVAQTGEFQVNQYTTDWQYDAEAKALANGGFVITWTSINQDGGAHGIYARLYDAAGLATGNEFQVNVDSAWSQYRSTIATLNDGSFVVLWRDSDFVQTPSSAGDITGRRFAADGAPMTGEFRVNLSDYTGSQINPSITALADGGFVAVWESIDSFTTYANAIRAQRFDVNGNLTEAYTVAALPYDAAGVYFPKVTARSDGGFTVSWQAKSADGANDIFTKTYAAQDITAAQTASTTTADIQNQIAMQGLAEGGYWAIWSSYNQDGSSYGVYAQRFDADGAKLGGEFRLNTTTVYGQYYSSTAQLSDGTILVSWTSTIQDGNAAGVFARRFNSDGTALSSEFQVNTYTTSDQFKSSVTALSDGGFFVSWQSLGQDGSGYGIYGQRFDVNSNKVGSEIQINSWTTGDQSTTMVAALVNGGYVVAWASMGQDAAATNGAYARVFDAAGNAVTGEFQVNVGTAGTQSQPVVAGLADGSFVIAWYDSDAQPAPGSGSDITARRYAADGTALTEEFRVNLANITNNQYKPTIAALSDGGFVVAWYTYSGSAFNAVMAQRFAADGTAGESYAVATQAYMNTADQTPSITALSDGGFAVGWQAYGPNGTYDVYTKAYHGWAQDFAPQTLIGGSADDLISGGDADDTLSGLGGADTLIGGAGADSYLFGRGDDADAVNNQSHGGEGDKLVFGAGIATDQLWFARSGNDLLVSVIGSSDQVDIQGWYDTAANQVDSFQTADGYALPAGQVDNLVNAMAAFAPPAMGQITLPQNYQDQLVPVIVANWHVG
ncbi:MAG: hypothetical protein A3G18_05400 [Rhodospirillales bacterium RIFCSPLOWO2_12_FULL_58_28]|nr:MAG: hypothetical protein A3G18_05400 [Rhodospirillales bacterium RIFCSPLOWO2_12_FULL_58_28]